MNDQHIEWTDRLQYENIGRQEVEQGAITGLRMTSPRPPTRRSSPKFSAPPRQVVKHWETEPECAVTMRRASAIRLGRLSEEVYRIARELLPEVDINDLMPIAEFTSKLGLSPSSKLIAEKCHSGELTCYSIGPFGTYVPRAEVDAMLRR